MEAVWFCNNVVAPAISQTGILYFKWKNKTQEADLNDILGNNNGKFEIGGSKFSLTAQNIIIQSDGILRADLALENGEIKSQSFNMDKIIKKILKSEESWNEINENDTKQQDVDHEEKQLQEKKTNAKIFAELVPYLSGKKPGGAKAIILLLEKYTYFNINYIDRSADEEFKTVMNRTCGYYGSDKVGLLDYLLNRGDINEKSIERGKHFARSYGRWDLVEKFTNHELGGFERQREIRAYSAGKLRKIGISNKFLTCLGFSEDYDAAASVDDEKSTSTSTSNPDHDHDIGRYSFVMDELETHLIKLICDRVSFSQDVLFSIWIYNMRILGKNNVLQCKLWKTISKEISHMLNIELMSNKEHKYELIYFTNNFMSSHIWSIQIGKDNKPLFYELTKIIKIETDKLENNLDKNLSILIAENQDYWDEIVSLSYDTNAMISIRNDCIGNGSVTAKFSLKELSLLTSLTGGKFNAEAHYDYEIYLNEIVMQSQILNDPFQNECKKIFSKYNSKIIYANGPVKRVERMRAKAQFDYSRKLGFKFPTTARVIDTIRCSLSCYDLKDYYEMIQYLIKLINDNKAGCIKKILRIKNDFSDYETKKLQNAYADIKFNVIVDVDGKSIVGEIQFILNTMLKYKKKMHGLYKILRQDDLIKGVEKLEKGIDAKQVLRSTFETNNIAEFCRLVQTTLPFPKLDKLFHGGLSPFHLTVKQNDNAMTRICLKKINWPKNPDKFPWLLKSKYNRLIIHRALPIGSNNVIRDEKSIQIIIELINNMPNKYKKEFLNNVDNWNMTVMYAIYRLWKKELGPWFEEFLKCWKNAFIDYIDWKKHTVWKGKEKEWFINL